MAESGTGGRRAKGREREDRVVAAARELIAERGLPAVRMSDVAERAGMTVGHVSYYFPSKNELLVRAIGVSEQELTDDVATIVARVRDPWLRLDRLLELSAAARPGDPGWVLWFQVWMEAALDPVVTRGHHELHARWRALLVDALRYGVDVGAFRAVDVDEVADLVSAAVDGLSIQLTLGAEGVSRARVLGLLRSLTHRLLDPA